MATMSREAGHIDRNTALLRLITYLKGQNYHFITPTPATHARILDRAPDRQAKDLRDIFGWSLLFTPQQIDARLLDILNEADAIEQQGDHLKSRLRVSTLGRDLFLHSAYPTDDEDAVFFGPDSYRFARLIAQQLSRCPQREGARLVDIGTGAGVGAIVAAHLCPKVDVIMTDINPFALHLARINAQAAGVSGQFLQTGDLAQLDGDFDLLLANPPYIADSAGRAYRDGGGMHGGEISLDMARQALPRLAAGGRFILYTGSAIVDGRDRLHEQLADLAQQQDCQFHYEEIDPDVFGEELETDAYRDVERIALIASVIERKDGLR